MRDYICHTTTALHGLSTPPSPLPVGTGGRTCCSRLQLVSQQEKSLPFAVPAWRFSVDTLVSAARVLLVSTLSANGGVLAPCTLPWMTLPPQSFVSRGSFVRRVFRSFFCPCQLEPILVPLHIFSDTEIQVGVDSKACMHYLVLTGAHFLSGWIMCRFQAPKDKVRSSATLSVVSRQSREEGSHARSRRFCGRHSIAAARRLGAWGRGGGTTMHVALRGQSNYISFFFPSIYLIAGVCTCALPCPVRWHGIASPTFLTTLQCSISAVSWFCHHKAGISLQDEQSARTLLGVLDVDG